jgi:dihydrofolate reductase
MAKLIYSAITSLDLYVSDRAGNFDWAMPDEEVHAFVNDLERPIGTHLYGRRMYETMAGWETMPTGPDESPVTSVFAMIWRNADKVVYSASLQEVASARTRIVRAFIPEDVRRLKASATQDISIGGSDLAASALRAGLVDEIHLILVPVIVGGGHPALPHDLFLSLELLDHRRFANGALHVHYRLRG